jgi:hypothetical protein
MKTRSLLAVMLLVVVALSGCAKKSIEIDVPDDLREAIEEAAPSTDNVFYVLETSQPQTLEELQKRSLMVCSSGNLANSAQALNGVLGKEFVLMYGITIGGCVKNMTPDTILLVEREKELPSEAEVLEVVFK